MDETSPAWDELSRMQQAIVLVLFEQGDKGLTQEQIFNRVVERSLLVITDEAFENERLAAIERRKTKTD